ncbi:MAG TPA: tyrosine-type recombinase/integrase [Acidimicrobiales bacterium]|nr:tyrosine-type recombinase/integrase [Acidimicrobiales bacterium]
MSIHRRVNKRRAVWIVRYRDPTPRERTFERKADAERFERYVRHQLDTDQYLDPESAKVTFAQWAARWWRTIESSDRAPSTISGYESALRLQVLPFIGERKLRTLRRIDMEEWLSELRRAGYSNSTVHAARTVAGMVISSALEARIIAANPLVGIRVPMASSRTRNALSAEQVESLATTVDSWWRPFVLVLAYCGLRPGEAAALRRKHLDDLGRLTIERALSEHRGRIFERDTKTHQARVVQVPGSVLHELREHLSAHVDGDPEALLFTTPSNTPVRISNWRHKVWQPAAERLALPSWATPYVLRHTAASLMAQRGVPVSAAAAALGHDPAIFLRTYAHLYPGDLRAVADAMDVVRAQALAESDTNRSRPVQLNGARGKRGEKPKGQSAGHERGPLTRKFGGGDGT